MKGRHMLLSSHSSSCNPLIIFRIAIKATYGGTQVFSTASSWLWGKSPDTVCYPPSWLIERTTTIDQEAYRPFIYFISNLYTWVLLHADEWFCVDNYHYYIM